MNLKEFRKSRKLSQTEIAEACGCTRQNVGYFEQEGMKPTVDMAKSIGKAYGIDWTIFFEEECKLNLHEDKINNDEKVRV